MIAATALLLTGAGMQGGGPGDDGTSISLTTRATGTGLVYTQGTALMQDGVPLQLFGVNDDMAFVYTHWGDYGRNYMFPDFDGTISSVSSPDSFWRAYFQHFLHYQQSAAGYGDPRPNLLRVTVGFDFGSEESYNAWKSDPARYYANFDAMVTWAKAAGVYLVPMLMQSPTDRSYMWQYYNTGSSRYAHLVEFERAMMSKYATEPTIAMWDVFNEADVTGVYASSWWGNNGNFAAFKAWEERLVSDVGSATPQLITVGHAMTSAEAFFPNDGFGFNLQWFNAFANMQGVDVAHIHWYSTTEDAYLYDLLKSWTAALGKPLFAGEVGYNLYPGPGAVSYGDWPYVTREWLSSGMGPVAEMTWIDNGKGAYADYPYYGALPNFPSGSFDFTVSLSALSGSAIQGLTASTTGTATLTSGTTQSVTFSASGLPIGGIASFGTPSCNPTCTSTLTITTLPTTPTGVYNVGVTATGGGLTRTATYALTVVPPPTPCPSLPPSYPSNAWDRVWCDSGMINKLADTPDQTVEQFDDNWDLGIVGGIRNSDIGFRSGRTLSLNAGTYTFTLGSDDGSRLWIDGTSCIDVWKQQAYTETSCTRTFSSAGSHPLRIDYYEGTFNGDGGQARVRFAYTGSSDTTPPTVGSLTPTSATVNVSTTFSATATDNVLVSSCSLSWDGASLGGMTKSGSVFSKTYTPTTIGTHAAVVSCVDTSGNTGSSTTNIVTDVVPPPPPPADTMAPATITDLRIVSGGPGSVTLRWTASGDDGNTGQATLYDFRYSTSPLTGSNWGTYYELPFSPSAPGSTEEVTIPGLTTGTTYWFAVRSSDEVPNWSPFSNVVYGATLAASNLPPAATYLFAPTSPMAFQPVWFDGSGSSDPDGSIVSYAWSFGDGDIATGPVVPHSYETAGLYTVILTVTDDGGLTGRRAETLTVVPPFDATPPATITDLRVVLAGETSITLEWVAPGDDDMSGLATWYDLRYSSTGPITASNFNDAIHVEIPFPAAAGSAEQVTITGLQVGTQYWFAIRTADETQTWSPVSNSPTGETRGGIPAGGFGGEAPTGILEIALAITGLLGGLGGSLLLLRRGARSEYEQDLGLGRDGTETESWDGGEP